MPSVPYTHSLRASDKRLIKNAAASFVVILALAGVGYAAYSTSQTPKNYSADVLGTTFSPTISASPTPSTSPSPPHQSSKQYY